MKRSEQSLRRRFPDRSTRVHQVSDVRQFQRVCPKPWAEVIVPVTTLQRLLGHHDLTPEGHHKDGDHSNNRLPYLVWLHAHCHDQEDGTRCQ